MIESNHEKNLSLDANQHGDNSNNNNNNNSITIHTHSETHHHHQQQQPKHLQEKRSQLFHDAGVMTKSLYRSCLRCIPLIRAGNEHDMADFDQREREQKLNRSKEGFGFNNNHHGGGFLSFEPPVDRENELSSRAMYYLAFAKEAFHQEIDCLEENPWRVDNVKRFLYLIRQGEERRKWLLDEYKFHDPYAEKWNEDKLLKWEDEAWKLVKETYELNGWMYQKDDVTGDYVDTMDDGIEWDETDDSEDGVNRNR